MERERKREGKWEVDPVIFACPGENPPGIRDVA